MKRIFLSFSLAIVFCLFVVFILNFRFSIFNPQLVTQPRTISNHQPSVASRSALLVYGYLPYWTAKTARLVPALTHISYFSLTIQDDGSLTEPVSQQKQRELVREYKFAHQYLELTITMMDQDAIPAFIASDSAKRYFLSELQAVLSKEKIDGVNIDIEYNGVVDGRLQRQFADLLKNIREETKENHPTLHLSIASYADAATIDRLTKPALVAPFVDHFVIMTYDYHRRASPRSGPIAPLYGGNTKWDGDIMKSLSDYTKQVPAAKILLGIPFYGYEWGVTDSDPQSFTLPKSGETATYERIQNLIGTEKTKIFWDETAFEPYLEYTKKNTLQRIYYEDALSLAYKLELVREAKLAGIAIWALGYEGKSDDFWKVIEQF